MNSWYDPTLSPMIQALIKWYESCGDIDQSLILRDKVKEYLEFGKKIREAEKNNITISTVTGFIKYGDEDLNSK